MATKKTAAPKKVKATAEQNEQMAEALNNAVGQRIDEYMKSLTYIEAPSIEIQKIEEPLQKKIADGGVNSAKYIGQSAAISTFMRKKTGENEYTPWELVSMSNGKITGFTYVKSQYYDDVDMLITFEGSTDTYLIPKQIASIDTRMVQFNLIN